MPLHKTRSPSRLPKHPTTKTNAISYIAQLFGTGLGFHFEDDPADILKGTDPKQLLFTKAEIIQLRLNVTTLFELLTETEVFDVVLCCVNEELYNRLRNNVED